MEVVENVKNSTLDIQWVRSNFPGLKQDFALMDNAGGAQVTHEVIKKITEYLSTCNVQLGASYQYSMEASEKLSKTTEDLAKFIGAANKNEVVVGPSTTMLLRILSLCLSKQWKPGDEIIVTNADHEANVSCWMDLQDRGIKVKIWNINRDSYNLEIEDLKKLLSKKTRLVTMAHVSNILGKINPVKAIAAEVHKAGALFCIDGVAFAPHRKINVEDFGADFYVFSCYKVFGPHAAVLYGKLNLLEKMDGINHYFIKDVPYKFQPGNFNFELTYALNGILDYFQKVAEKHETGFSGFTYEQNFANCFNLIAEYEESLSEKILGFLSTKKEVKLIGSAAYNLTTRVPTISFIHKKLSSKSIVNKADSNKIGIRYGDFYSKKLVNFLEIDETDGVVRISLVHYNSLEEVNLLIEVLEQVL